jgi:CheY-like chemotaxis protein
MRQGNDKPVDGPAGGKLAAGTPYDKPVVLVVDDEHLVRIMVQMGLERNGFDVWLASSGRQAIELYRRHRDRIAVVLLDVQMPDLDGPQTLDTLRALNPQVRTCFMSGDTGCYEPEELLQRGAAHLIAKPFHLHELTQLLRMVVDGARADAGPAGDGRLAPQPMPPRLES